MAGWLGGWLGWLGWLGGWAGWLVGLVGLARTIGFDPLGAWKMMPVSRMETFSPREWAKRN